MVNDTNERSTFRSWKDWKRENPVEIHSVVLRSHNYSPTVGEEEQRYGTDRGCEGQGVDESESDGRIPSDSPSEVGVRGWR